MTVQCITGPKPLAFGAAQGQLSAIWHHSISATEFALLKRASFRRQARTQLGMGSNVAC